MRQNARKNPAQRGHQTQHTDTNIKYRAVHKLTSLPHVCCATHKYARQRNERNILSLPQQMPAGEFFFLASSLALPRGWLSQAAAACRRRQHRMYSVFAAVTAAVVKLLFSQSSCERLLQQQQQQPVVCEMYAHTFPSSSFP